MKATGPATVMRGGPARPGAEVLAVVDLRIRLARVEDLLRLDAKLLQQKAYVFLAETILGQGLDYAIVEGVLVVKELSEGEGVITHMQMRQAIRKQRIGLLLMFGAAEYLSSACTKPFRVLRMSADLADPYMAYLCKALSIRRAAQVAPIKIAGPPPPSSSRARLDRLKVEDVELLWPLISSWSIATAYLYQRSGGQFEELTRVKIEAHARLGELAGLWMPEHADLQGVVILTPGVLACGNKCRVLCFAGASSLYVLSQLLCEVWWFQVSNGERSSIHGYVPASARQVVACYSVPGWIRVQGSEVLMEWRLSCCTRQVCQGCGVSKNIVKDPVAMGFANVWDLVPYCIGCWVSWEG
uniref:Uncharacterized protein n=1 Tax=Pyrodinium bahamense TaxID=73915 RepID=A0A7S0B944_9DINO